MWSPPLAGASTAANGRALGLSNWTVMQSGYPSAVTATAPVAIVLTCVDSHSRWQVCELTLALAEEFRSTVSLALTFRREICRNVYVSRPFQSLKHTPDM
jgi:hypothetical protein